MKATIRVTAQVRQDLDGIWANKAEYGGSDAADALLDQVQRKFLMLSQFPESGVSREELAPGLRSTPVQNYLIFYRYHGQVVEIVRVLAGRLDLESILGRES